MKTRKLNYKSGSEFFSAAHTLKNSDMPLLFEFFNPKKNQVQIFGFKSINGDAIPLLLESLGYDVSWKEDGFWKVQIPEEYRCVKIIDEQVVTW